MSSRYKRRTFGQDMLQEATSKLKNRKSHLLLLFSIIVFITESYVSVFTGRQRA